MTVPTLHCPCRREHFERAFEYDEAPPGETVFDLGGQKYRRRYLRCGVCRHWFSDNEMDMSGLYSGAYVDGTYGDRMHAVFQRVVALPAARSDNAGRVARILEFGERWFAAGTKPSLLDVGSGLAVFPFRMQQAGWRCTALDPDARAAAHARDVAGVEAITGEFPEKVPPDLGRFDVITFNKVLEHVPDPVQMLRGAMRYLEPGGFVYLELPDIAAAIEGPMREEFFIEHLHVFSPASTAFLAERSGFSSVAIERVREPSSKWTIRAFLAAPNTEPRTSA